MLRLSATALAVATAIIFGTAVQAQQPPAAPPPLPDYGPTITLDQAMKAANAALVEAKKSNVIEAIAVVGPNGVVDAQVAQAGVNALK